MGHVDDSQGLRRLDPQGLDVLWDVYAHYYSHLFIIL